MALQNIKSELRLDFYPTLRSVRPIYSNQIYMMKVVGILIYYYGSSVLYYYGST